MLFSVKLKQKFHLALIVIVIASYFNTEAKGEQFNSDNYKQRVNLNELFKPKEAVNFYMFASFSLSDNILRQMIDYTKAYNGIIVFRGLKENSFRKTADHIQGLVGETTEAPIIIDPPLFKKFNVKVAPTYVLTKQKSCPTHTNCLQSYDKISGNITPKYALNKFYEKGDLSHEAKELLEFANEK